MATGTVKVAVLLSGSGRTLENFLKQITAGTLPLQIVAVASSRENVRGLDIARENQIPDAVFKRADYSSVFEHNLALNTWLSGFDIEIIILAGYLCFYIPAQNFTGPVVNIHPALLPAYGGKGYYGDRVHQAVLNAGDSETGCTVHLVDDQYDTGTILGQQRVPIHAGDDVQTLAARVFQAECELYPQVLRELAIKMSI